MYACWMVLFTCIFVLFAGMINMWYVWSVGEWRDMEVYWMVLFTCIFVLLASMITMCYVYMLKAFFRVFCIVFRYDQHVICMCTECYCLHVFCIFCRYDHHILSYLAISCLSYKCTAFTNVIGPGPLDITVSFIQAAQSRGKSLNKAKNPKTPTPTHKKTPNGELCHS